MVGLTPSAQRASPAEGTHWLDNVFPRFTRLGRIVFLELEYHRIFFEGL
jgi:hypothetical protein